MIISCIVLHRKVPDFGFCCGSKLLLLALLVVDRTFSFASIMLWQLYWFGIRSSTKLYCFSLFYVNPIAEVAIGKLSESAETVLPSVLHSYSPFRKSQSLLLNEKKQFIVYWLVLFDGKKKLAKRGLLCGRLSLICGFGLSQIGRRNQ